jgi:hypothetical protein
MDSYRKEAEAVVATTMKLRTVESMMAAYYSEVMLLLLLQHGNDSIAC